MLSKEYAQRVAGEKANWSPNVTSLHIMRFLVKANAFTKYINGPIDNVRSSITIPQSDLTQFNQSIIGYIERVESITLHTSANEFALS